MHTRRDFCRTTLSCGAYLAAAGLVLPRSARAAFAGRPWGRVQAVEPWGRIEEIGEGAWAVVSTPLAEGDFTTLSNGGLIVGHDAVLAVEGLASPEGARWVSDFAQEVIGRRPTHVIITHYHSDHSVGQGGYRDRPGALRVLATEETHRLLEAEERERLLPNVVLEDGRESTTLDLGGRSVRITARSGHTSSDVTVEIEDPRIVWCGDLVWNGLFPNYRDAQPLRLMDSVRRTLSEPSATYVPGHGDLSGHDGLRDYVSLLEDVGEAATRAFEEGRSAEEGGQAYEIPASLGEWARFNERYYEVAFAAWYRDLGQAE